MPQMQLLETIKCEDGKLFNMLWHTKRFNQARKDFFGLSTKMNLNNFIKVPSSFRKGLYRCRISYSKTIEKVEYISHEYRTIFSLKLVVSDDINYQFKYTDREKLNNLFEQRGDCDDILIIKNGCIADSFTANAVFFDGQNWWTPDTPLLPGTQRAKLIDEGNVLVCRITPNDLAKYQKVGLINAMWDMGNMPQINIKKLQ